MPLIWMIAVIYIGVRPRKVARPGRLTMPRASKKDAAKHRQEIISAAARLFRERGIEGVSVPELMEAVGLTHGGFYRHFTSKDELVSLALAEAFVQSHDLTAQMRADHPGDAAASRQDYI